MDRKNFMKGNSSVKGNGSEIITKLVSKLRKMKKRITYAQARTLKELLKFKGKLYTQTVHAYIVCKSNGQYAKDVYDEKWDDANRRAVPKDVFDWAILTNAELKDFV